jgi:predicted nucleic acid-binding protein
MDFWDTSALVSYLIEEQASPWARRLLRDQGRVAVSAVAKVELLSALYRSWREGRLTELETQRAVSEFDYLCRFSHLVKPSPRVLDHAGRFVKIYPLRTLDALQLGSAKVWQAHFGPESRFVTCDGPLPLVAAQEGFEVLQP